MIIRKVGLKVRLARMFGVPRGMLRILRSMFGVPRSVLRISWGMFSVPRGMNLRISCGAILTLVPTFWNKQLTVSANTSF